LEGKLRQQGCRIFDGDQPRVEANGMPVTRLLFFPSAACEILDTWHSMFFVGQCPENVGSGSMIEIGGHLAVPPLPHHRAYGSRTTAVRPG